MCKREGIIHRPNEGLSFLRKFADVLVCFLWYKRVVRGYIIIITVQRFLMHQIFILRQSVKHALIKVTKDSHFNTQ